MRRITILTVLMTVSTLLAAGAAFTQAPEGDADRYIVVLEENVDNPAQVAEGIEERQESFDVGFIYSEAPEGFSAEIPVDSLDEVRNNPRVDYVERNRIMTTTAQTLPWGVDRIGADESSADAGDGDREAVTGVNIYTIDTGIDTTHQDLNVVDHHTFRGRTNSDCYGHGTHVAGTLAALDDAKNVVGVAPGAPLTGLKVIGCNGAGTTETVREGVDWVAANAVKPAVVNMSVGGPQSDSLDEAIQTAADNGIFFSVSAGNNDRSACGQSPASAGLTRRDTDGDGVIDFEEKINGIVTTAATGKGGGESGYSNHGKCVDLWAPGNRILSTKLGGGQRFSSGTSMAAPHVGGTATIYLSDVNPSATPKQVEAHLKTTFEPTGKTSEGVRPIQLVSARNASPPVSP